MILNAIFAALALLSLILLLWQWVAARRFPLHQRSADLRIGANEDAPDGLIRRSSFQPAVTLLKSLKGADASTEDCLRSWFVQEYAGEIQILFGVASTEDPVCAIVGKLIQEFPKRDVQLVFCPQSVGANAKVSKLAELEKLAKHEILVVSDADVRVPADFLVNAAAPFNRSADIPVRSPADGGMNDHLGQSPSNAGSTSPSPIGWERAGVRAPFDLKAEADVHEKGEVGLVNCFYRLANPSTLAMQWEAIAINADFWSQVLQSQTLKPLDFALGAVILTRRKFLDEIGGFKSLADCLADDYQLGNRIARNGHRIVLCPVVVECWDPPMSWRAVWKHQLRWARTIRVCQPVPYFFSILSDAGFWALLSLVTGSFYSQLRWNSPAPNENTVWFSGSVLFPLAAITGGVALLIRVVLAQSLQARLTRSSKHVLYFWLVPIKDVLQAVIWVCAFAGNRIEWRGQIFKLRRDGTLVKTPANTSRDRSS